MNHTFALDRAQHLEQVRAMRADGMSYRAIGRVLGVNHETVSDFVRRFAPELYGNPEVHHVDYVTRQMRLLVIDIETRPNMAYVWGVWNQTIRPAMLIDEKEMISFAAKWLGEEDVEFMSIHHDGKEAMVLRAWELLDEADGVIGYNSKSFDGKHINNEFLFANLMPPSPFRHIDLLQTMRREFKFTSNKLEHVASKLGIGSKVEHEGFALWEKCLAGDDGAWSRMREYNKQDVALTEELYYKLLPWLQQHPSYAAFSGERVCVNCGSDKLRPSGYRYTRTGQYKQYQCNACGKWQRDTHRSGSTDLTGTSEW